MDEIEKEKYKKIALRFLKDAGLYKMFYDYLLNNDIKKFSTPYKGWYKKTFINDIFGDTYFTHFIERKYLHETVNFTITDVFKAYVRKNYPEIVISTPIYYKNVPEKIDEITSIVKIFNEYEEKKQ